MHNLLLPLAAALVILWFVFYSTKDTDSHDKIIAAIQSGDEKSMKAVKTCAGLEEEMKEFGNRISEFDERLTKTQMSIASAKQEILDVMAPFSKQIQLVHGEATNLQIRMSAVEKSVRTKEHHMNVRFERGTAVPVEIQEREPAPAKPRGEGAGALLKRAGVSGE